MSNGKRVIRLNSAPPLGPSKGAYPPKGGVCGTPLPGFLELIAAYPRMTNPIAKGSRWYWRLATPNPTIGARHFEHGIFRVNGVPLCQESLTGPDISSWFTAPDFYLAPYYVSVASWWKDSPEARESNPPASYDRWYAEAARYRNGFLIRAGFTNQAAALGVKGCAPVHEVAIVFDHDLRDDEYPTDVTGKRSQSRTKKKTYSKSTLKKKPSIKRKKRPRK